MFDWGVGEYERTAAELEPAARHVVELAIVGPGERVLDLACGTGNAALLAAAAGAHVTGLDAATRLIEVARTRRMSPSSSATPSTCRSTTSRSTSSSRCSGSSSRATPSAGWPLVIRGESPEAYFAAGEAYHR